MGLLQGHSIYMVGSIDDSKDFGVGWRRALIPKLKQFGLVVFDPTNKKVASLSENEENLRKRRNLKELGQFDELRRLGEPIRHADLRSVDLSSFLIAYLDFDIKIAGTYDEIFQADRQRKPVLIVCKQGRKEIPDWLYFTFPQEFMFDNFDDMLEYLHKVDRGEVKNNRWVLFDYKDLVSDE